MQMPLSKEYRERRRRQNRESQQRRRQRQKQPSGATSTSDGSNAPTGQILTAEEGATNTPLLTLPPSPPYPEYLQGSQALVGYLVQDPPHWSQHQPKGHEESQQPWPLMGLDFPITRGERDANSKGDGNANMVGPNRLGSRVNDMITSPPFQYQSPTSGPPPGPNLSSQTTFRTQPHCNYPKVQDEQLAVSLNHRRSDLDPPAACVEGNSNTNQDIETRSPAEKAIKEVQVLYKLGVKVGFLKRNDRVRNYLATMRRTYHKMPLLRDEDEDSSSYSDTSYDGDSEC